MPPSTTGVGHAFARRPGLGELIDQLPQRGPVLAVEPALEADPAVAPVTQSQLPGRCGLVVGSRLRAVGVEKAQHTGAELAQRGRVQPRRPFGQVRLGPFAIRPADIRRECGHRLGYHPQLGGPTSPAANPAAVAGHRGGNGSPDSARRGATCPAWATRARASDCDN